MADVVWSSEYPSLTCCRVEGKVKTDRIPPGFET